MTTENKTIELALGRIFRLLSRPVQMGDAIEYERCRAIILNELGDEAVTASYRPNYARDHKLGATGD